jgi:transposase
MTTILGLDPHPGSHTVVALNAHGAILESLRVSNDPAGIEGLLEWRKTFTDRRWAIEGAFQPLHTRLCRHPARAG